MEKRYQTFYHRPYSTRGAYALISLLTVLFIYLHGNREPGWSPFVFGVLGIVLGVCFWAIVLDPDTAYYTTKRLGDEESVEGGEDGSGEKGREVTVKRPFIGYEHLKYRLETPDWMGDTWFDGVRHEDALIRI